jgi:hypothetical protein
MGNAVEVTQDRIKDLRAGVDTDTPPALSTSQNQLTGNVSLTSPDYGQWQLHRFCCQSGGFDRKQQFELKKVMYYG